MNHKLQFGKRDELIRKRHAKFAMQKGMTEVWRMTHAELWRLKPVKGLRYVDFSRDGQGRWWYRMGIAKIVGIREVIDKGRWSPVKESAAHILNSNGREAPVGTVLHTDRARLPSYAKWKQRQDYIAENGSVDPGD